MKREYLGKGVNIVVSDNHTFGTDAVLLANFADIKRKEKACDFGTGCGIIPMLWVRDDKSRNPITAVEIQKEACELLENSIAENGFEEKISVNNFDIKNISNFFSSPCFDVVTMNPPYYMENSGKESDNESIRIARHEVKCDIFLAAESASKVLKFSGRFCVCHRSERLCDVFEAMRKNGIEPKILREVYTASGKNPYLILVEGRKGGKNGLKILPPLIMYDKNGNMTEEFKEMYSGFYEGDSNG